MKPLVEFAGVVRSGGGTDTVQPMNFALYPGCIAGIVGNTGSGKTGMLELVAGLRRPAKGLIAYGGKAANIDGKPVVSYVPALKGFENHWRVKDLLRWYNCFYENFSIKAACAQCNAMHVSLTGHINQLSPGMQTCLRCILTLACDAKIYLLDEPLDSIDPFAKKYLTQLFRETVAEDTILVLTTSQIYEAESLLDDVLFISGQGVLLHESCDAIREANGVSVSEYYMEVLGG